MVVKTALKYRLDNECEVLKYFRGRSRIRQLVDEIQEPAAIVLEHLGDNLLNASNSKRLGRLDIKFIAKGVLEALNMFHEAGYVHTGTRAWLFQSNRLTVTNADQTVDVKPDNILVNYGDGPTRFSEVKLGDCGDTYRVDPNADPKEEGHIIGAAIFRSPEAMLNLKWGTPTDIWSFGATVSDWICSRYRRINYALLTLVRSS